MFSTLNQQKHAIISQIISPLHVSTLSLSPSDSLQSIPCTVTPVFQMQLSVIQFTIKLFHTGFMPVLILQPLKCQYYKIFKTLKLSYLQHNSLKSLCCYNSQSVSVLAVYTVCMLMLLSCWPVCTGVTVQGIDCRLSEGDSDSVETCRGVIICEIIVCICWFIVKK